MAEADWTELDRRKRGTHFVAVTPRSVLNRPASTGMAFWSINPYIGCEFGCAYCYARDTHRWAVERARDSAVAADEAATLVPELAFERRILVKQGADMVLQRTLRPSRLEGHPLVIGTATDPYQPAERTYRLTRALLETLMHYRGLHLGVITKSTLVARDAELLASLSARHTVSVHLSLASLDAALLRRLEPRTPAPHARLRAMRILAAAGVRVGILIAPILPGLTDSAAALRDLLHAARTAGAAWAGGSPLRMNPATRRTLLPWLQRERPALARRYQRHYGTGRSVSRGYAEALQRRLERLQREAGFEPRNAMRREEALRRGREAAPSRQMELFVA